MRPRRTVAALILLALALARGRSAAAGSWYEDYFDGIKAVEARRWDDAIRLLESARAQAPQSALKKKTYGLNFTAYLPNLYLGIAYLGRGDTARALQCLEAEEAQDVVLKSKDSERFREAMTRARAGVKAEPVRSTPATPVPPLPSPTRAAVPTATSPAAAASRTQPPSTATPAAIEARLLTPTPSLPSRPRPTPTPTATATPRAAATPAATTPPRTPAPSATIAGGTTPAGDATPTPPGRPPRPALRQALLALLGGDVEAAIDKLEHVPLEGGTRDADVHAFLAVAYARSALAEPDHEKRAAREQKAVERFQLARKLDPGYQLSERLTSPRVRELLARAR